MHVWLMLSTAPSASATCSQPGSSTSRTQEPRTRRYRRKEHAPHSSHNDYLKHVSDDGDKRVLMSKHPCVLGVNGDSSAHVEGAEDSTQLSLTVLVLQNCVSAWKMTVDGYVVVRRAHSRAPHPLVLG